MTLEKYKDALKGKLVLLNAPKSAGKDTIANRIIELTGCKKGQFKDHLYLLTAAVFNVDYDEFVKVAMDTKRKEEKIPALGNLSPREALIMVSEKCIKPVLGKEYFGNIEAMKLRSRIGEGVVYADCGFIEEVHPLIGIAKPENTFVIKFTRKGCESFAGDSRNWLPEINGVRLLITANNSTVDELAVRILEFVLRDGKPLH